MILKKRLKLLFTGREAIFLTIFSRKEVLKVTEVENTDKKIFVPSGKVNDLNDIDWIEFLGHDAGEFISEEELGELEELLIDMASNKQ